MQTLHLAEDQFPKLLNQNDSVTIRKGWRVVSTGSLVFVPADVNTKYEDREVHVFSVELMTVHEVPEKDCVKDGCQDWKELLTMLQEFYPEMTSNDPVTVIRFWTNPI